MTNSKTWAEQLELAKDYQWRWRSGESVEGHYVVVRTEALSPVVAIKYGCRDKEPDLRQEALISLGREGHYEGKGSLDAYITKVLVSKVREVNSPPVVQPRKRRKKNDEAKKDIVEKKDEEPEEGRVKPKYVRLDDETDGLKRELADPTSLKLADKVLLRMESERFMRELIKLPKLERTIIEIVLCHEEYLSQRKLAEEAEKVLKRKVSRDKVKIAMKRLSVIIGAWFWPV